MWELFLTVFALKLPRVVLFITDEPDGIVRDAMNSSSYCLAACLNRFKAPAKINHKTEKIVSESRAGQSLWALVVDLTFIRTRFYSNALLVY